jgi:hypothetical protein
MDGGPPRSAAGVIYLGQVSDPFLFFTRQTFLISNLQRSVHNVRIERLWVDVTAQVSAAWADQSILLELQYGLNINNIGHIWLLQFLFLTTINSELAFFTDSSNQHKIQIQNGPNRSSTDMFVKGVCGDQLLPEEEDFDKAKLGVYGIDWQGLRDEDVLRLQRQNNPIAEGSSSWISRVGPPPDLSEVIVQPPAALSPTTRWLHCKLNFHLFLGVLTRLILFHCGPMLSPVFMYCTLMYFHQICLLSWIPGRLNVLRKYQKCQ